MADLLLKTCTNTAAFGEWVQYIPKDGAPVRIKAIYDEPFQEIESAGDAAMNSTRPKMGVRLADLQGEPGPGDKVIRKGIVFLISEPRPDGRGGANFFLEKIGEE